MSLPLNETKKGERKDVAILLESQLEAKKAAMKMRWRKEQKMIF